MGSVEHVAVSAYEGPAPERDGSVRHRGGWDRFAFHYVEMVVAMFPLMLALMLRRRDEYLAHAHHNQARE